LTSTPSETNRKTSGVVVVLVLEGELMIGWKVSEEKNRTSLGEFFIGKACFHREKGKQKDLIRGKK